jgi:hypothetical protein
MKQAGQRTANPLSLAMLAGQIAALDQAQLVPVVDVEALPKRRERGHVVSVHAGHLVFRNAPERRAGRRMRFVLHDEHPGNAVQEHDGRINGFELDADSTIPLRVGIAGDRQDVAGVVREMMLLCRPLPPAPVLTGQV